MCEFLRDKRDMLDMEGNALDITRAVEQDPRPRGGVYDPPRLDFYDSWDEWIMAMERPREYADILFAKGFSYVYGVTVSLLVDYLEAPVEFYLGPAQPTVNVAVVFRSGGLHYSATRPIPRVEPPIAQKRKSKNKESDGTTSKDNKKQNIGNKKIKNGYSEAQKRATAKYNRKKKQSKKDKQGTTPSPSSTLTGSNTQASTQSETKDKCVKRGKRRTQDMEMDSEVEGATKRRRSSRLEMLNVNLITANDVVENSSEIIVVCIEGPEYLDHG